MPAQMPAIGRHSGVPAGLYVVFVFVFVCAGGESLTWGWHSRHMWLCRRVVLGLWGVTWGFVGFLCGVRGFSQKGSGVLRMVGCGGRA